jgi:hypothetical protein
MVTIGLTLHIGSSKVLTEGAEPQYADFEAEMEADLLTAGENLFTNDHETEIRSLIYYISRRRRPFSWMVTTRLKWRLIYLL